MRLTDLIRDAEGKKKDTGSLLFQPDGLSRRQAPPAYETEEKKEGRVSGHLRVRDLATLYDLSSPPRETETVPVHPEAPREEEVSPPPEAAAEAGEAGGEESPAEPLPVPGTSSPAAHTAAGTGGTEEPAPSAPAPTPVPDAAPAESADYYGDMEEFELADALHIELLSHLDDIYEEGKSGEEIYVERLVVPLQKAIELCKTSNALLRKAVRLKKGGRSFTSHSLNVAIISIKIGLSRKYSDERVFSLALCALLGDIGMTRVDPAILNKPGKLTPEEFAEIKKHVEYSVEIVNMISYKFPFLGPIIYQIHERENGSGYPLGLKGPNIHEFAKIIGMCDVYVALTEPKANRENYSGYVAMQQIISRRGIDFDPKVIKSLIDVISVFPLESLVRLNNGAIGRVIDISPVHPTRPKLSILIDSDGEKLNRPVLLDLEQEPLLYIENPDIEEGAVL